MYSIRNSLITSTILLKKVVIVKKNCNGLKILKGGEKKVDCYLKREENMEAELEKK